MKSILYWTIYFLRDDRSREPACTASPANIRSSGQSSFKSDFIGALVHCDPIMLGLKRLNETPNQRRMSLTKNQSLWTEISFSMDGNTLLLLGAFYWVLRNTMPRIVSISLKILDNQGDFSYWRSSEPALQFTCRHALDFYLFRSSRSNRAA